MRVGRRGLSSIEFKATALVCALTGALVIFLATYLSVRHARALRGALRDKAATYGHLVSRQVESGIAFDDRETIREVFAATAEDPDVRGLAAFDANGRLLVAQGKFAGGLRSQPNPGGPDGIVDRPSYVRATTRVVASEGATGTLVVELSTARVEAERSAVGRAAGIVALASLAVGFVAAWLIARSLSRRLRAIADATAVIAEGELSSRPLLDDSHDEVGHLARAFNAMSANIRTLVERIRESSAREAERLDALVRARTIELDERNADMRLVLDNVSQGLLVIDHAARPDGEHSAVVDSWFGEIGADETFGSLIGRLDARAGDTFRLNWQQLEEGALPFELCLDQLPRALRGDLCEYEIDYTPIVKNGNLEKVLVVISDATERLAAERAEAEQREILRAIEGATRDRGAFLAFIAEARSLVDQICAEQRPPLDHVRRALHTLKGNAALSGLSLLADFCHEIEGAMAETGADLDAASRAELRTKWDHFAGRLGLLIGNSGQVVAVPRRELDALLAAIEGGRARREIFRLASAWELEPARGRLEAYARQARALAERLGKGVAVAVHADDLLFSPDTMGAFWAALTHAVRNALGHGLELDEERVEAGKACPGTLRLSAQATEDGVVVEVADDGRGIDWDAVREKARQADLPCETASELEAALFHDGLSTREDADDLSGRGLGMGALRIECERLGGRISVTSERGRGTVVAIRLPAQAMDGGSPSSVATLP